MYHEHSYSYSFLNDRNGESVALGGTKTDEIVEGYFFPSWMPHPAKNPLPLIGRNFFLPDRRGNFSLRKLFIWEETASE